MKGDRSKWVHSGIRLVAALFVLAFAVILGRAFHLQVLCGEELQSRAERQHQRVIPLTPQRGVILERNGEELAVSIEVDSVYVHPRQVEDPKRYAPALASALELPLATVKERLASPKGFQWLKRRISPQQSEAVRALKLPGVNYVKEHQRFYPNAEIAAQVVGFTGLDPDGLEGVELRYDAMLLGKGGYLVAERDGRGQGVASGDGEADVLGREQGHDLVLTIDRTLQYVAEKELAAGVAKAKARSGVALVLDPQTGEVLAMASEPNFNPNALNRHRPHQWRNRSVCDTFEPGSTFKIFLMAAAIEEGVVTPRKRIYCEEGKYRVGGRVIHDTKPYGSLTVQEILKFSSNIGVSKVAKSLERERYYDYITRFGFGETSGIDLPGEVAGLVRPPERWFEVDLAAISFGQGLSVTPLQLAAATAAIANGGYLMTPYVVNEVRDAEGRVVTENQPRLVRRVISEETARTVRQMMTTVVEEGGTGTEAAVPGFRVAGKTGTAQKVDPVTGGYSVDKRVASFVGMVPAEDPRLVVLVVIDEPEGISYGGLVAGPVFSRIAEQGLRYLKVSPTEPVVAGRKRQDSVATPEALALITPARRDREKVAGGRMPDFQGMSLRQVLRVMEERSLNIRLEGSGRAVAQQPRGGESIAYGSEVWVRFAGAL